MICQKLFQLEPTLKKNNYKELHTFWAFIRPYLVSRCVRTNEHSNFYLCIYLFYFLLFYLFIYLSIYLFIYLFYIDRWTLHFQVSWITVIMINFIHSVDFSLHCIHRYPSQCRCKLKLLSTVYKFYHYSVIQCDKLNNVWVGYYDFYLLFI